MIKQCTLAVISFSVLFLLFGSLLTYVFMSQAPTQIQNVTINQAEVLYIQTQWAENLDNPEELLFQGWVYNFGPVEAKGLKLKCMLWDKNDNLLNSFTKDINNVASYSSSYVEVTNKMKSYGLNDSAMCIISECEGCNNLMSHLPEFREYYQ